MIRLDYSQNELTGHGARSMVSTILKENGWQVDVTECRLAHVGRNATRVADSHAECLEVRCDIMQWWADLLDGVKEGNGTLCKVGHRLIFREVQQGRPV